MEYKQKADKILQYWFGEAEGILLPTQEQTHKWFAGDPLVDADIMDNFSEEHKDAISGHYEVWENHHRGTLALIVVMDQFSRHMFRNTPHAFAYDQKALDLCLRGIEREYDHLLSLLERAFFYFPLMHSESTEMQSFSVRAFQMLVSLSFPETRSIYEQFLEYAVRHYEAIRQFGRFPQRNEFLGRESTPEELEYLKKHGIRWGD